jgi:hypothetical protein
LDWLFAFVGTLLILALGLVVKAEQYMWLIFLIGAAAVVAIIALEWFISKARSHKAAATPPPASVPH